MNKIVSGQGPNIRAICAQARRLLGVNLHHSREKLRSGGEDGLWRVHLQGDIIVECSVIPRSKVEVHLS